jgi:molybdopterin/thiamine biosynthesis adenylyltransferase
MIAIVGLGTLGVRVAKQLPAGTPLLLIDYDTVEEENLGTQYPAEALGLPKVEACRRLYHHDASIIHKHIDVTTIGVLAEAELVIDCTDNMLARYLINDYCAREGIPWIHSAMSDTAGTVAAFVPGGPCFACVYPKGTGETCTRDFARGIADHTAQVAVQEAEHVQRTLATRFIRVGIHDATPFAITKRAGCPTCAGNYTYLELAPQAFYITYCQNAHCMAAKPLKHSHEHGTPKEQVVNGIPVSVFPNGEIHFHQHADDDVLFAIAKHVYMKQ